VNVELEVAVKVKLSEETPTPQAETRKALNLAGMLGKIASHPCVALIVRALMRNS
jgi:hypothetical protein